MISNMSLEAADHSEFLWERLGKVPHGMTCRFAAAVRAAQAIGEVRDDVDANNMADVLLTARNGAVLSMAVDRSPDPLDCFKRVVAATLISAVSAKPAAGSRQR